MKVISVSNQKVVIEKTTTTIEYLTIGLDFGMSVDLSTLCA